MKRIFKSLPILLLGLLFSACAKESVAPFVPPVKKDPAVDAGKLNSYAPLKTYVNRKKYPNFKLGAGVTVSKYLSNSDYYELYKDNFDELTAGNAMKHSSCVKDGGVMDFSQVKSFVAKAKQAKQTIYGHTLVWHSQQRVSYLNSLIAPIKDSTHADADENGYRPMTTQEMKDTLTYALKAWIKGSMKATGGYVTSWDLVNEAISGGGDINGYYVLQSMEQSKDKNHFFWQDYLGSIDFVRIAEKSAREEFKAAGGDPEKLLLFINDYNLESDWDKNKKVKSLIYWINQWESDGKCKIDGIGTQMHVSYHAKESTQKSKENAIVEMYRLLAASGKLIKITELDMGYVDAEGNSVKTPDMKYNQLVEMADFYKFIISKYFEIIPAEQCYGISQWCLTDSPANSGWRANEPVGILQLDYERKPAYEAYVEALQAM